MKSTLNTLLLLGTIVFILTCSDNPEQPEEEWGESGKVGHGMYCWIIIADDDSTRYEPINLGEEFQQNALGVKFEFKFRNDLGSICMSGDIIEVTRIEEL